MSLPTPARPADVLLASLAVADPMGQQAYEERLRGALRDLADPAWRFRDARIRSIRQRDPGDRRLPLSALGSAPAPLALLAARYAYGRPDLLHRLDLRLPRGTGPEVITVHDFAPLRFPDEGAMPAGWERALRRADAVIVPSRFTADEVADRTGVVATVIPHGHDPEVASALPLDAPDLEALGIRGPFVLHAGGATRRKNLAALAEAWREASPVTGATLVLCGPRDARRDACFTGVPGTVSLGRLERGRFVRLLAAASAVVVPSIYEGFGLPVLEAMTAGVPVVAADSGALPEVGAGHVRLADPTAAGMAAVLVEVLEHPPAAAELAAARDLAVESTWEACAAAHLAVYRGVLEAR